MLPAGFSPPRVTNFHRGVDTVYVQCNPPLLLCFWNKPKPFCSHQQFGPSSLQECRPRPASPAGGGDRPGTAPPSFCLLPPLLFPGHPFLLKTPNFVPSEGGVLDVPSSPSSDPKRLKEAGLWSGSLLAPDALPTGGIDHEVPSFAPRCHLSSWQLSSGSFSSPLRPPACCSAPPFLGFPAPSGTPVSSRGQQMKGVAVHGGLRLSTRLWNSATSSVP